MTVVGELRAQLSSVVGFFSHDEDSSASPRFLTLKYFITTNACILLLAKNTRVDFKLKSLAVLTWPVVVQIIHSTQSGTTLRAEQSSQASSLLSNLDDTTGECILYALLN